MAKLTKAQKLDIYRRHLIKIGPSEWGITEDKMPMYIYYMMRHSWKELCELYSPHPSCDTLLDKSVWREKQKYKYIKITGIKIFSGNIHFVTSEKTISVKRPYGPSINDINESILNKTRQAIINEIFDINGNIIEEKAQNYLSCKTKTFVGKIRQIALARGNHRCCFCGRTSAETTLEVDHIIPWSQGGATSIANSRVVCPECNKGVYHSEQKNKS